MAQPDQMIGRLTGRRLVVDADGGDAVVGEIFASQHQRRLVGDLAGQRRAQQDQPVGGLAAQHGGVAVQALEIVLALAQ